MDQTPTPKSMRSPRGVRESTALQQTALAGHSYVTLTGLTASTEYAVSAYFTGNGSFDHTARIHVSKQDLITDLFVRSEIIPADGIVRMISKFTTEVGQTSARIRLYGGTASSSAGLVGCFGLLAQLGHAVHPIVLNYDATLNTSPTTTKIMPVTAANALIGADEGAIEVVYDLYDDASVGTRQLWHMKGAVSGDGRNCAINAAGVASLTLTNGAGGTVAVLNHAARTTHPEWVSMHRWRAKANLPVGSYTISSYDGATQVTSASTWTSGAGIAQFAVGNNLSGIVHLAGGIQRIRMWNGSPIAV